MAKPEEYKGEDAVAVTCLRDYTVHGGTGAGAQDVEFVKGRTYHVSPRSAAHLLRKTYAIHKEPTDEQRRSGIKRGTYQGDAPFFVDKVADAEQADADAAQAVAKQFDGMTVAELNDYASGLPQMPEGWSDMNKAAKVAALKAATA